jgi:hypothetical protein
MHGDNPYYYNGMTLDEWRDIFVQPGMITMMNQLQDALNLGPAIDCGDYQLRVMPMDPTVLA